MLTKTIVPLLLGIVSMTALATHNDSGGGTGNSLGKTISNSHESVHQLQHNMDVHYTKNFHSKVTKPCNSSRSDTPVASKEIQEPLLVLPNSY